MKRHFMIGILLSALLIFVLGFVLIAPGATTAAQTEEADPLRTIFVTGYGRVEAQPDMAVVRLGVQTEADAAEDALNENNERMMAVISATQQLDIDEADIQTQGINLQPVYDGAPGESSRELTGYRASNIVQITVRDLEQLGTLLDTAVAAGGNTIEGIRFNISDRADLEAEARAAAMENAMEKAEQLTSLAGASLAEVQMISESGGPGPVPLAFAAETATADAVPVSPGTEFIEATVQVTWQIR